MDVTVALQHFDDNPAQKLGGCCCCWKPGTKPSHTDLVIRHCTNLRATSLLLLLFRSSTGHRRARFRFRARWLGLGFSLSPSPSEEPSIPFDGCRAQAQAAGRRRGWGGGGGPLLSGGRRRRGDLAAAAASLLADLTDSDDPDELAGLHSLADALVEANALDLLVHNLSRFSEADPDEAEAVHHTLSVVENLLELRPQLADIVCDRTKLLRWLLARLKAREFDANKQYASEILAILLQDSPANQKRLGNINGVDGLLQAVAMYKSRDPKTSDEEEMLENLFDCLCCVLMPMENKERFVKAEGVELMIIIMKQKKLAYSSAIRTLDFAMTRFPPACERFVDVLGLKTAFAAFMGKIPVNKKNKKESYQEALEERVISLIASLFGGITKGSRRIRLLGKFVENECEKIDRLMEFYTRYSERVKAETERLDSLDLDDLEMDEDERYNRKLEAGLYTLQLIALILGHIWHSGNSQMRTRIELLLRQNKLTKDDVKDILEEYHDNIGDLDGPEEKERAQGRTKEIIASLSL
uniref:Beta-catenin-like protein 1 N-terminal domain-containing protein n=1 Tax=Oryza punctata TaxID=4537 RepID=A0A0E0K7B6_ORYPU